MVAATPGPAFPADANPDSDLDSPLPWVDARSEPERGTTEHSVIHAAGLRPVILLLVPGSIRVLDTGMCRLRWTTPGFRRLNCGSVD